MSNYTEINTNKRIEVIEVCKRLVDEGYQISVKNGDPTTKVYIPKVSIREIDITEEDYGYEVGLNILACKDDFEIYRDIVKHILEMTNGEAVYEGNKILDTSNFFDMEFIEQSMDRELSTILLLAKEHNEIAIPCPFRNFVIGTNIYKQIANVGDNLEKQRSFLYNMIRKSQYENISTNDTPIIEMESKNPNSDTNPTLTIYKQNEYDYVTSANYFALTNEQEKFLIINYSDLPKIAPQSWKLIDEKQYMTSELSGQEWSRFWQNAKQYETEIQ